jgi:Protein of unknown function (DUF3489)
MPKLSDTQAVLLTTAAARPDLTVLPPPETVRVRGAALDRTLRALVARGLIAEAAVEGRAQRSKWVSSPLVVTPAGLAAIGVEPAAPEPDVLDIAWPQRPGGKLGILLAAVARPEGATLGDLTAASGWLPHTARAALTRLRQRGYDVRLADTGSRRAYHLVPAE